MQAFIKAISYYLPETVLSNEELNSVHPEWGVDKIETKTGIKNRHIAAEDEYCSDMALKAAEQVFKENQDISKQEIDFILYCTQSPDYFLPTTACILQDRLGIPVNCGALDFNLGCSGYVYGLGLAKGLICSGMAKNVLLITSETYSKYISKSDKSNKTIFGDGASATIVSISGRGLIKEFSFGTDGKGANNLIVKEGARRFPLITVDQSTANRIETNKPCLYMNGPEIFSFTSSAVPTLITDTLQKNDLLIDDIDLFIFHQANQFMLEHLRKKIGIPKEKFFLFLQDCGNTVSSTIPIALKEAMRQSKASGKILLAGFGVGYSWGGTVLEF